MSLATEVPAPTLPGKRRVYLVRALAIALLGSAFIYAVLFALEAILSPLDFFDESITILAARAVGSGRTPHGDFWVVYPALSYWILAAAFKIFGNSYLVARFVPLAFYLATVAVGWIVTPDWRSRTIVVSGLILSIGCFYWYAPWNAFALLLIVLLLFCWKRTDTSPRFWLFIGLLLAASLLMRLNFAGYGLIAISAFLLVHTELTPRQKLANLGWLCAPMVLAVLAYCIICRNCLPALYAQVIYFPTHAMMRERILLIRSLAILLLALPFLLPAARMWRDRRGLLGLLAVLAGFVSLVYIDLRSRHYIPRPTYALAFAVLWIVVQVVFRKLDAEEFTVLLCYLLFLHYYLARADLVHFWPAFIVLCLIVLQKLSHWPLPVVARVDLVVLVLTGTLGLYLYSASRILVPNLFFYRYAALRLSPEGHNNLMIQLNFPQNGEAEALAYLIANTTPDEYVYSGLLDHARGYANNLRDYVILQRPIPVSDWQYEPGYSSEAHNQELAIDELERTRTNWLLLWQGQRNANQISGSTQGSSLLDIYIRSTFCLERRFGDYQVWRRCNWSPSFSRN
jgi:hypothetical protein